MGESDFYKEHGFQNVKITIYHPSYVYLSAQQLYNLVKTLSFLFYTFCNLYLNFET